MAGFLGCVFDNQIMFELASRKYKTWRQKEEEFLTKIYQHFKLLVREM